MTDEEGLVYCANCKYHRADIDQCMHPGNRCIRDTYLCAKEVCDAPPSELNQFNDCEWFVSKWWGLLPLEDVMRGWWRRLFAKRGR